MKNNKSLILFFAGIISVISCFFYAVTGLLISSIIIYYFKKNKGLFKSKISKMGYYLATFSLIVSSVYLIQIVIFYFIKDVAISTAFGTMPWDMF